MFRVSQLTDGTIQLLHNTPNSLQEDTRDYVPPAFEMDTQVGFRLKKASDYQYQSLKPPPEGPRQETSKK